MVRQVVVKEGQYKDSAAIVADGWNANSGITDPKATSEWLESQDMILEEAVCADGSSISGEGWYRIVPKKLEHVLSVTQDQLLALLNKASLATVLSLVESGMLDEGHGINWIDANCISLAQGESTTGVLVVVVPKENT